MDPGTEINELYQFLSPTVRAELSRYEEKATVPAGTKLMSEVVIPEHLIAIERGSVEISVPVRGKAVPLTVAGAGKVLGLRPIVADVLPEIEAMTIEECKISRISRQAFLEVLSRHPEMYLAIAKVLSADLNTVERFLRERPKPAKKRNVRRVIC